MPAFDPSHTQLSVIIVSADSGPSLRDCVKSVLACTVPLELLLIDNASSDGIPQAIARARENDARFKVIYNHANLGFGPAVNRAASQAHGDALLILNPDCLIDDASLRRLLGVLATEHKAGLVGRMIDSMRQHGRVADREGAIWFASMPCVSGRSSRVSPGTRSSTRSEGRFWSPPT